MESINLKSTEDTPKVVLDAANNIFEISGRSLPEDVGVFFGPILDWLNQYASQTNASTVFVFRMVYFNTASSKNILMILRALKEIHDMGKDVTVEWYYHEDDEEMQEAGDEFARISKLPFKLIEYFD